MNKHKKSQKSGYLILEILIAITVLAVLTVSLIPSISFMVQRSRRTTDDSNAALIAQTAMEATYHIFLNDWNAYPNNARYQLITDRSVPERPAWVLGTLDPDKTQTVQGKYERDIEIQDVLRDPESGKSGTGSVDEQSKKVIVTVTWTDNGVQKKIETQLILTKFST